MHLVRVALVVVACGCYGPSAPSGAPCDPETPNCPGEQVCRAEGGVYTCGAPLAVDGAIETDAVDAPPLADGPNGTTRFTYAATIAECASPNIADPDYCRSINGNSELVIDQKDSMTNQPWYAFVRFDLDSEIAGKTISQVTLRVVATTNGKADGPNTGDVWRVSAFSLASLNQNQLPAKQGSSKIAGSQGAVQEEQVVQWPLPVSTVSADSPVYLGIFLTTSDGVNYWNTDGPEPPQLIIDASP